MPDTNQDKLRITQEFDVAEAAPAPAKQKFFREIDLGDGSGKQRWEADTAEELLDKVMQAQVNATKKIQELSRERRGRAEPEKLSSDFRPLQPVALKPEEIEPLQKNPHELFRRMFQAEFGMSADEFRLRENERRRVESELVAQDQFVQAHPDYVRTQDNAKKILTFLRQENLPVSKRNLDYAFGELREELVAAAASSATPVAEPAPAPARESSSPPSSLRPSFGGRAPSGDSGGGIDAAEIARIERLSNLGDIKSRIEELHRQSRTAR